MNANGTRYVLIGFLKNRVGAYVPRRRQFKSSAVVQLTSGYIRCGTSDTLMIDGSISMEWFGGMGNADADNVSSVVDGATVDDTAFAQFPVVFRSDGADRVAGHMSYGMGLCEGQTYEPNKGTPDGWRGSTMLVATSSTWKLRYSTDGGTSLAQYPANPGVRHPGGVVHWMVTFDDETKIMRWYLNGEQVKVRQLASDSVTSVAGHELVIGGRKRGSATPDHATSMGMRTVRLYARALSAAEARQNHLSHYTGFPAAVSDYREEWLAKNASGTTLAATVDAANNGTITNGLVIGV
jgi:hypothetical protein